GVAIELWPLLGFFVSVLNEHVSVFASIQGKVETHTGLDGVLSSTVGLEAGVSLITELPFADVALGLRMLPGMGPVVDALTALGSTLSAHGLTVDGLLSEPLAISFGVELPEGKLDLKQIPAAVRDLAQR